MWCQVLPVVHFLLMEKKISNSLTVMRTINRLFAAALVLFAAAACYNKEIEAPDNQQDPVKPLSSEVKLVAKIPQTRVTYTSTSTQLTQAWKEGDVVFGFYGDNDKQVVLTVGEPVDGSAPLTPAEGYEDFITELAADGIGLQVALVYTGSTDASELDESGKSITVNMSVQSTNQQIPACMHANGCTSEDGETFVFNFANDCAILEIVGITGVSETVGTWTNKKLGLASVSVSGVNTSLAYSYAEGVLSLSEPTTPSSTDVISFSESLYLDSNGNIVNFDGKASSILMAVPANTDLTSITVSAGVFSSSYTLSSSGLTKGKCYVVKAQDVVAKTEDGLYFKTVTGAFDHAADLSEDSSGKYNTAAKNIVTLVRDCGLAGINSDGSSAVGGSSPLVINEYDVTLDLNGHVLTLAGKKDFFVVNGEYDNIKDDYVQKSQTIINTFIINDFKGKNADGKYDGKIYYLSDDEEEDNCELDGTYMINNLGNLQIDGGTIWHNDDWSVVSNYASGELTINGGTLHSESYVTIYNDGTVTINNGTISVGDECEYDVISNNNILTVNDGTISSESSVAIHNYFECELTINGGIISSAAPKYISNDGDLFDHMGTVTNTGGTLTILGGTIKTTSDQVGHSALWTNAQADISGGTISSINGYAIYAEGGPVNISQGDGDPCVISTETEIALILYSSAVGTISGGTITSSGKCAVSMNQKSSLTVSGGIISCTGLATGSDEISASAIQCRANNVGDSPTLTVTWPEGDYTAIPDEPLLYSKSDTPIAEMSAKIPDYPDFYSMVTIKGGCLYNGVTGGAFFRQYEGNYKPLQDGDDSYFYTNSQSMSNVNYAEISLNSEAKTKSIPATFHKIPNADDPLSFGKNYIKIVRQD